MVFLLMIYVDQSNKSWVGEQIVCYLTEDKQQEHVIICLNFPTLPLYLKDDIDNMVKNKQIDVTNYKGFIMEQAFYQYFEEPKILAVHIETKIMHFTCSE